MPLQALSWCLAAFCLSQKVSGELHAKIQAEFERLRQILVEEERVVLMELAKEEEESLVRLQGDIWQLENGILELERNMECIQQALHELGDVALVEVSVWPVLAKKPGQGTGMWGKRESRKWIML